MSCCDFLLVHHRLHVLQQASRGPFARTIPPLLSRQNGDQVVIPFFRDDDPSEVALQFGEKHDLSAHAIRRLKDVIIANRDRVQASAPLTSTTRVPMQGVVPAPGPAPSGRGVGEGGAAGRPGVTAPPGAATTGTHVPRRTQRGRSPGALRTPASSASRRDPFAEPGVWLGVCDIEGAGAWGRGMVRDMKG